MPRATTAEVAMYFSLSIFNPVRNDALNAPPVPIKPTIKPEIPPPKTSDFLLAGKASLGLIRNKTETTIRNIPNMSLRNVCDRLPTNVAPIRLRTKLGIPNISKTFQSSPCLKNVILLMFPKSEISLPRPMPS